MLTTISCYSYDNDRGCRYMVSDLKWTADNIQDQGGKTVLVTGANSGLGLGQ